MFLALLILLLCIPLQIAPLIKKGNEALVHHFVVYECVTNIAPHHMNQTGPCDNPAMPKTIRHCRGKSSMYAWAVGGKVTDTLLVVKQFSCTPWADFREVKKAKQIFKNWFQPLVKDTAFLVS